MRRKELKVRAGVRSVRSKDPLSEFKKKTRGEVGRYDIPGELWRGVKKLIWLALLLAAIWFISECYQAWDIFGGSAASMEGAKPLTAICSANCAYPLKA